MSEGRAKPQISVVMSIRPEMKSHRSHPEGEKTIAQGDDIVNSLKEKAQELRKSFPRQETGQAPQDHGIRLATFPRPEGELRFTWNVYEGRPFLRFQLWTKDDSGQFWPSKIGFTVKVRDIPALADAIGRAVDLGIDEARKRPQNTAEGKNTHYRASEGVGAQF